LHWGTFPALTGTPEALAGMLADLPGTTVARLAPGESLRLG
jgi:hypothetical protein